MDTVFLLEIGVEELPAIPLLRELPNIKNKFSDALRGLNISIGDFELFYTPRRIVIYSKNFNKKQDDILVEHFGPPLESAYKDGAPTQAAIGFAKKCGVELNELQSSEKNGKKVLYYNRTEEGVESRELVSTLVKNFLTSLTFGKSMRWGSLDEEFIRPIRWISLYLDGEFVDFEAYGVRSGDFTYQHRSFRDESVSFANPEEYFKVLEMGCVILDPRKREERILNYFKEIEDRHNLIIKKDSELLEEVVAITEYPTPLLGCFEERFLKVPPEMITTSMREHQRYFSIERDEKLTNGFIVVSNALAKDFSSVIKGNEKVLRARLSDAMFFYENDLKSGFDLEALNNVTFAEGLGSIGQKAKREEEIALHLFDLYKDRVIMETNKDVGVVKGLIARAAELSKGDLVSQSVYEFTELQGIMGYYFAKEFNENTFVANSIKEQYLPKGEDSELPSSVFSSIISMSLKIDNIFGLFSIDKIPSGSKDPFALRRSALGVIRIALHYDLPLDIRVLAHKIGKLYKKCDIDAIERFFNERLYSLLDCNPSIISSVIKSGETDNKMTLYKIPLFIFCDVFDS